MPPPVTPPVPPAAPEEPKDWGPLKPIRPVPKPSGAKMEYVLSSKDNPALTPETGGKRKGMLILAIVILVLIIGGGTAAFIFFGKKSDEVVVNNANTNSTVALSNSNVNKNANINSNQNVNSAGNVNTSNTNISNQNVPGGAGSGSAGNAAGNTNQVSNSNANTNSSINSNVNKPITPLNLASLPDTDGDGIPDEYESYLGTSSTKADTDGDGYNDGAELSYGFSPIGPGALTVAYYETYCQKFVVEDSKTKGMSQELKTGYCTQAKTYIADLLKIQQNRDVKLKEKDALVLALLKDSVVMAWSNFDLWCTSKFPVDTKINSNSNINDTESKLNNYYNCKDSFLNNMNVFFQVK